MKKETNELILKSGIASLGLLCQALFASQNSNPALQKAIINFFMDGLTKDNIVWRRSCLAALSDLLNSHDFDEIIPKEHILKLRQSLFKITFSIPSSEEASAILAMDTGSIMNSVIASWMILHEDTKFEPFSSETSTSQFVGVLNAVLSNGRVLSKLTDIEDQQSISRLLNVLLLEYKEYILSNEKLFQAVSHALNFQLILCPLSQIRSESRTMIYNLCQLGCDIIWKLIIQGAVKILVSAEENLGPKSTSSFVYHDLTCKSDKEISWRIFRAIASGIPVSSVSETTEVWKALAQNAIILCHPMLIQVASESGWCTLCRIAGVSDPTGIVSSYGLSLINSFLEIEGKNDFNFLGEIGNISQPISDGFYEAFSSLLSLFIALSPKVILPPAILFITKALSYDQVKDITSTDIEIFGTPAGFLHTDPTVKSVRKEFDDRPKTETEEWELKLRKELSKKQQNGINKSVNISKKDRALIESQMEIENQIRNRVQKVKQMILSGLDLINAIISAVKFLFSNEVLTEIQSQFRYLLDLVLHGLIKRELIIHSDTGRSNTKPVILAGSKPIETFCRMGQLTNVEGTKAESLIQSFIPMTILRVIGVMEGEPGIPKMWCRISIESSILKMLTLFEDLLKMNDNDNTDFNSDLSPCCLNYIFPFIWCVVTGSGQTTQLKEKTRADIASRAGTILASQAVLIGESSLAPRVEFCRANFALMSKYDKWHVLGQQSLREFTSSFIDGYDESHDDLIHIYNQLLEESFHRQEIIRMVALESLAALPKPKILREDAYIRLLIHSHDTNVNIQTLSQKLLKSNYPSIIPNHETIHNIVDLVTDDIPDIRKNAAKTFSTSLDQHREYLAHGLSCLFKKYKDLVSCEFVGLLFFLLSFVVISNN